MSEQLSLIAPVAPVRPTLRTARIKREAAMSGIAIAVEHEDPAWFDQALDAVRRFASNQHGVSFTTESMRSVLERELPPISRLRVWGPLTQAAMREGYIVKTGGFEPAASSNGSPKPLYRRGPKA